MCTHLLSSSSKLVRVGRAAEEVALFDLAVPKGLLSSSQGFRKGLGNGALKEDSGVLQRGTLEGAS